MKGPLRRSLIVIFSALAALSLAAGVLTLASIRQSAEITEAKTALANLRLRTESLSLRRCQAAAAGVSIPVDTAVEPFLALKQLTWTISALSKGHSADGDAIASNLANQLETLRDTYLSLLSSYSESSKMQQVNQELLTLVKQRLSLGATPLPEKTRQTLDAMPVQITLGPQESLPAQLKAIEGLQETMTAEVADPAISKALETIINNYRQNIAHSTTIRHQEQALDRAAAVFTSQAESAINDISSSMAKNQARHTSLICALIFAHMITIVVSFELIRRRLLRFQNHAALAMQSIRAGHVDSLPEPNHEDELTAYLKFLREAGDRLAQNETMLAERHHQWQTLFDTMSEWVLTCDTHGLCLSSNPRAEEMTGLAAAQLINQPLAQVLEGCADATLNATIAQALTSQRGFDDLEHQIQHQSGALIPVITKGQPIFDTAGTWQGLTLFIRDLSEKHRAETQLVQATRSIDFLNMVLELALLNIDLPELMSRFLDLLIELSWVGIQPKAAFFLIDKESHRLTMAAQRGLDNQVIRSCALLPIGTCLCGRAAQSGKVIFADCRDPRHEINYPGMAIHGHFCLPVHTVAGEIIGVVVLYLNPDHPRDSAIESILINAATMIGSIIRRRQAEDELRAVNQDLERRIEARTAQLTAANQELDSFSYSVSHDLRAPLRSIDGFSLALSEDYGSSLPHQAQDYLARIRSGCSRMDSLINDLLSLSRLSRLELKREKVNLSQMAADISQEIRAESPDRVVEWLISPDLEVSADPTMIRAALFNLLANAWKYSAKTVNARIELGSVNNNSAETVFFIRDNGAGFDMRYANKLFTAFQRLHTADQFPGNGIGLATVKRIIHCHGGKIWAEGTVGAGATFYFTLPHHDTVAT